jgi:hypothetical protein
MWTKSYQRSHPNEPRNRPNCKTEIAGAEAANVAGSQIIMNLAAAPKGNVTYAVGGISSRSVRLVWQYKRDVKRRKDHSFNIMTGNGQSIVGSSIQYLYPISDSYPDCVRLHWATDRCLLRIS